MLHVSQRRQLYAMFSTLFSYPDRVILEQLVSGQLLQPAQLLDQDAQLPKLAGENDLEALQVAFTDLFINRRGGVPAPPYGSVYLDAGEQLHGPSTGEVAQAYQAAGLVFEQSSTEPADFLATELEFLYFLVGKEEQGFERRDLQAAQSAVIRQARFFQRLFAPWIPEFCGRIAAEPSAHPVYAWAAARLACFCATEQEWLTKIAPE
ncbi:molecular chaperone TorD family protein [Desulfuromonas carbonis]|uniref:TorD/DmsD family molecular chaperone n=1 Tax=Desulfuromonas sp. DDH964 TaxID=1823759 RepID=UPI00078B98EF|nr:molecular chaperone TorD family protein [Desulfuromonas sp. DDH964]AMV71217.1 Chaperone protein TorD [Desulfuromonas sp. DDH964]